MKLFWQILFTVMLFSFIIAEYRASKNIFRVRTDYLGLTAWLTFLSTVVIAILAFIWVST